MFVQLNTRTRSETPRPGDGPRARDEALARCAVYVALALGFTPPGRDGVESRLASARGARELAAALAAAGVGADGVETLVERPPDLATHRRLFGHTARGSVPPYGTEYGNDTLFQQPQRLADAAGFFSAFGLRLEAAGHERVDHVRCQLEFLAFLARKEAHALETGDAGMLAEIRRARRLFLRDHLGRFAPALGERLRREDPQGFYGVLGEVLRRFVEAECRRSGVAAGSENLVLRPDDDDGAPMACGGGAQCLPGGCPE